LVLVNVYLFCCKLIHVYANNFDLILKAQISKKICRKIHWFPADFPADISFKGLKTKRFEHTRTNLQQKRYRTKTKNRRTYIDENDI
jgi:hypothetical protein